MYKITNNCALMRYELCFSKACSRPHLFRPLSKKTKKVTGNRLFFFDTPLLKNEDDIGRYFYFKFRKVFISFLFLGLIKEPLSARY